MPRYLTPSRIGLLVLIRLYQAGDQFGAHATVDILHFIAQHTVLAVDHDSRLLRDQIALSSSDIRAFHAPLRPCPAVGLPGTTAWDVFVTCVWAELHSLDSLTRLITELKQSSVPVGAVGARGYEKPVTPASPLGQFIRRCSIEFTRLQFGASQALWKSFAAWKASSWPHLAAIRPEYAQSMDRRLRERGEETHADFVARTDFDDGSNTSAAVDTDLVLTNAIQQVQRLGTRVPDEVKTNLANWVDELSSSSAGAPFFLAFFEHSRNGQYTMALESLHRYFDYSLVPGNGGGTGDNSHLWVYYQYALLHLSALHADFDCWEESVEAMNECIATARENQDTSCLNFASSWLLALRHAHPGKGASAYASIAGVVGGGEHDEIAFLKTKARESKGCLLMASTLLDEGRHELRSCGGGNRAQEHVLQALHLCVQHNLLTLVAGAQLFYGTCLERLGQSHLASRHYELANIVHAPHCLVNDRIRSCCRSALALAHQGSYTSALAVLDSAAPIAKGILKSETRLKGFSLLIYLRRTSRRGNHEASAHYLNQLLPLRAAADPEFSHECDTLQFEHHLARKDYSTAMEKVSAHLVDTRPSGSNTDIWLRLYWLIQKARIFTLAGRAAKGFSICLRATSTAARHLLVPIMLEGLSVLGRILLEVAEFDAARAMYESALPVAVEGGNADLVARMWVGLGESCVGLAGKCLQRQAEEDTGPADHVAEQVRWMRRADECIERGRLVYQKLEDVEGQLECLAMKSRILQWSGDEVGAKQADEMYTALLVMKREQEEEE